MKKSKIISYNYNFNPLSIYGKINGVNNLNLSLTFRIYYYIFPNGGAAYDKNKTTV